MKHNLVIKKGKRGREISLSLSFTDKEIESIEGMKSESEPGFNDLRTCGDSHARLDYLLCWLRVLIYYDGLIKDSPEIATKVFNRNKSKCLPRRRRKSK